MKISRMIPRSVLATAVLVLGLFFGVGKVHAYPATPGCDNTGCHFDIRNNNDHGNGSLRTAIDEGCKKPGNHLVEFARLPDSETIALESQLSIPSDCQGTFEFAGLQSKEITIDGSALPKADQPSGSECSLYIASNNHKIHHLTFTGAPFGICLYGSNITISDNNIGVKRDGSVAGNANGLYINGNSNNVWYNNIAGNTANGIVIVGHQNLIQVNSIGVISGQADTDKGNGGSGIRLNGSASANIIGGDINGLANIIRYNKAGGVVLAGDSNSTRNKISHNHIARNQGLGIDLNADGVSLPQANPSGPNNMLAMPTEVQVVPLQVSNPTSWAFLGKAPTNVTGNLYVEVYVADSQDDSDPNQKDANGKSYGEGDTLLVSKQIVRGSDGKFGVTIAASGLTVVGHRVSAILRDEQGNTSEFSTTLELQNQPNPPFTTPTPICGDGKKESPEECDDGKNNGTTASCCDSTCHFKTAGTDCNDGTPGQCAGSSDTCNHPVCGNSTVDAGEDCDEGSNNGTAASCCDATCHFKSGGTTCNDGTPGQCSGSSGTCIHPVCGNGTVEPGEACDDGNKTAGDGCSATCTIEPGWTCTGSPSVCHKTCGNGTVDPGEQCDGGSCCDSTTCQFKPAGTACDDGNATTSNDQCNSTGVCSGTPGNTGPLNPPSNLTAKPTPGSDSTGGSGTPSVTVTFTDNSNNEDGFHIERADGPCNTASNFTTVGTAPASPGVGGTVTFVDNSVQAGQTYCYRARAFNDDTISDPSNSDTVTLPNPGVGSGGPLGMDLEGGGCAMTPVENANHLMSFLTLIGSVPMAVFRMRRKKSA